MWRPLNSTFPRGTTVSWASTSKSTAAAASPASTIPTAGVTSFRSNRWIRSNPSGSASRRTSTTRAMSVRDLSYRAFNPPPILVGWVARTSVWSWNGLNRIFGFCLCWFVPVDPRLVSIQGGCIVQTDELIDWWLDSIVLFLFFFLHRFKITNDYCSVDMAGSDGPPRPHGGQRSPGPRVGPRSRQCDCQVLAPSAPLAGTHQLPLRTERAARQRDVDGARQPGRRCLCRWAPARAASVVCRPSGWPYLPCRWRRRRRSVQFNGRLRSRIAFRRVELQPEDGGPLSAPSTVCWRGTATTNQSHQSSSSWIVQRITSNDAFKRPISITRCIYCGTGVCIFFAILADFLRNGVLEICIADGQILEMLLFM